MQNIHKREDSAVASAVAGRAELDMGRSLNRFGTKRQNGPVFAAVMRGRLERIFDGRGGGMGGQGMSIAARVFWRSSPSKISSDSIRGGSWKGRIRAGGRRGERRRGWMGDVENKKGGVDR